MWRLWLLYVLRTEQPDLCTFQIKTVEGTKVSLRYPFLSRYPITFRVNLLTPVSNLSSVTWNPAALS